MNGPAWDDYRTQSAYVQRIFQRIPWVDHRRVSMAFLRHVQVETSMNHVLDELVVSMSKQLLADPAGAEDVEVPVTGKLYTRELPREVLVELPRTWWERLRRRPARSRWCPVVGEAAIAGAPDFVTVTGTATVQGEMFTIWPEETVNLPEEFGTGRRYVQYRQQEPLVWRGPDHG